MVWKSIRFRRTTSNRYLNGLQVVLQVAILWGISTAADIFANVLHSPIPGSIIGFAALFLLLKSRVVKLSWVEKGADFLLRNLLLFFLPAAVGIIQYGHLVQVDGIRLFGLILISIVLVMSWTGWLAERLAQRQQRKNSVSGFQEESRASKQRVPEVFGREAE